MKCASVCTFEILQTQSYKSFFYALFFVNLTLSWYQDDTTNIGTISQIFGWYHKSLLVPKMHLQWDSFSFFCFFIILIDDEASKCLHF